MVLEENKNFRETEATRRSEDTAETETFGRRKKQSRIQGQQLKAVKKLSLRVPARNCQRSLDSIEIEVPVKGDEPAEGIMASFLESRTELNRLKKQLNSIDLCI